MNSHEEYLKYLEKWRKDNPNYWKEYFTELKRWAVDKLGRKCSKCGLVSEHDCIYDFHHEDEEKTWSKGQENATNMRNKELLKWKRTNKIPEDVKLLCANCHRIEHS